MTEQALKDLHVDYITSYPVSIDLSKLTEQQRQWIAEQEEADRIDEMMRIGFRELQKKGEL